MDPAEDAASKLPPLYAELAAKSSRVAELEARVSALEAENAGLREALAARREAAGSSGEAEDPIALRVESILRGAEDPIALRVESILRGTEHEAVEKRGGAVASDAIEVSDDEEGADAVGASKGGTLVARREAAGSSGEAEDPIALRVESILRGAENPIALRVESILRGIEPEAVEKRGGAVARDAIEVSDDEEAADAVGANKGGSPEAGVGESEDEADAEDAEGGGGSDGESSAGLEDEDVSVTPRGKKRGRGAAGAAARVVISDSEDDAGGGDEDELGSGNEEGLMSSSKRAFRRVSDSEDEDGDEGGALHQTGSGEEDVYDMVPIYELLKRVPSEDGDESDVDKGRSAPTTRRSARLVKRVASKDDDESDEAKGHSAPATRRSARLGKNQSKSNNVFRGVSDSEDEDGDEGIAAPKAESGHKKDVDDMVPIHKLLKRMPKDRASEDDDKSDDAKGHSAPATRRSARLAKNQSKSNRVFRGASDSEDEDGNEGIAESQTESGDEEEEDMVPICKSRKRKQKERASEDGDESDLVGHSTPASRRSARLAKNQSKGRRAACPGLHFVEPPKDVEGSEDDMEEDDDMNEFINDGSSDNASGSAEDSCDESDVPSVLKEKSSRGPELSDGEVDYKDVMDCIGRKKKAKEWDYEADMLAAFGEHPELCLKALCAIYRKQTEDEQVEKASLFHNKQGFSHKDALRGSRIAEFLMDGDRDGPLKKTVSDLDEYDRYAFEFCRKVASHYSKQLFAIYQNKEDPYFHP